MKKKHLIFFIVAIIIFLLIAIGIYFWQSEDKKFKPTDYLHEDFTGYDKLMIIAHPDDDMIWGGTRLINEDYVVVCITCGVDKQRVEEFVTVMSKTHDKYIMLGYPDKTNGEKDNWDTVRDNIKEDIKKIIALKDWQSIVTHNPDGEYGHIHHKMTSNIVTALAVKDKLYYFGKYYNKKAMSELSEPLSNEITGDLYDQKIEILKLYQSQSFIFDMFDQMFPYENWLTYEEWQVLYGAQN